MADNEQSLYDQEWPDEFILRGGRIFSLYFPSVVFRRFKGEGIHPERRVYIAPRVQPIPYRDYIRNRRK